MANKRGTTEKPITLAPGVKTVKDPLTDILINTRTNVIDAVAILTWVRGEVKGDVLKKLVTMDQKGQLSSLQLIENRRREVGKVLDREDLLQLGILPNKKRFLPT